MNQGERLKALRKALNIKQGDFARKISTTQGHISDIENGRKNLSERSIKLICFENWGGKTVTKSKQAINELADNILKDLAQKKEG